MISNQKKIKSIKNEIKENFNPVLGISINRFAPKFWDLSSKEFGIDGFWVFISGSENSWSLNHKEYQECKWFNAKIDGDTVVYNFLGEKTTAVAVYTDVIIKMLNRNHFVLDHEDAGFFIPITEKNKISNIQEIELKR